MASLSLHFGRSLGEAEGDDFLDSFLTPPTSTKSKTSPSPPPQAQEQKGNPGVDAGIRAGELGGAGSPAGGKREKSGDGGNHRGEKISGGRGGDH